MSALIHCQNISKSFGSKRLFKDLTIGVDDQDRVGIIGPNGSGKSTLVKIMAGHEEEDDGIVTRRKHIRLAYIAQESSFDPDATVFETVERAAREAGLRTEELVPQVRETLGRTGFHNGEQPVGPLSGGWQKRLAIACGFVQNPDVMLLDEPTNHLDLEGMQWLAQLMSQAPFAWLMVSHDRWFLEHATNKVAELNNRYPDGIFLSTGTYSDFLLQREEYQHAQTQQAQALSGKVRREVEWLRRGPKARTTKAKSRIDSAHALQAELADTTARLHQGNTEVDFVGSGRKTKRLIVGEQLGKKFGAAPLIKEVEVVLSPGMRVGLLGNNGSGKSTLLKLLAKTIEPDKGTVTHAEDLQVVYFDQHREQLNPTFTLRETMLDSGDHVTYRERPMHIVSWAKRFQFRAEQLDLRIDRLSGGEQARAVIARLMLKPADVLLLDEPTNDLDIPTLEVLEESMQDFPGAMVLVTHDRHLLTQICTTFIGLDGQGTHGYFAEYEQWEGWLTSQSQEKSQKTKAASREDTAPKKPSAKKPTYKEQQELNTIEERILEAETELEVWRKKTEDPAHVSQHAELQQAHDGLHEAQEKVQQLYTRWAELEAKLQGEQVTRSQR
ncbi:MAG TPA: ABC transporter ATP-binding protein [Nitrospirales bacterium]|nr:ABC transporter ATP-binding protein [Nitrospirales bacterium]HIN33010.1 ABC transporter ATP-binding protein [Nitrospirales bacterium]HIO21251.1 ABC transporter ATP-binding protein [Nitrospirales bacterium]